MSLFKLNRFLNNNLTNASNYNNYNSMKKISIYINEYNTIVKVTLPNFTFSNDDMQISSLFEIESDLDEFLGDKVITTYITYIKNINNLDMNSRLNFIKKDLRDLLIQLKNIHGIDNNNYAILFTFDGNFSVYSSNIDQIIEEFTL